MFVLFLCNIWAVVYLDECWKDRQRKKRSDGGEGRFEINCLSHPIIISAWLLNCPVGPMCAECMLKSISAAADTAAKEKGGIYAV